jgi:hypothetical protein
MNNLYHKLAVVSVCTTLSFILEVNKEAKAATIQFQVEGNSSTGIGETIFSDGSPISVQRIEGSSTERRTSIEYDLRGFSIIYPEVRARSATFSAVVQFAERTYRDLYVDLFGYVGNGRAELSDFNAGVRLGSQSVFPPYPDSSFFERISFDVTHFVNERIRNDDDFWGFSIRVQNSPSLLNYGTLTLPESTLSFSVEPVPEPTTIFGSVIGLGLGGWLKRKKSSQQRKTTP